MATTKCTARVMSTDQNTAFGQLLDAWRRLQDARLDREAYAGLVDARFAFEDARVDMRRSLTTSN